SSSSTASLASFLCNRSDCWRPKQQPPGGSCTQKTCLCSMHCSNGLGAVGVELCSFLVYGHQHRGGVSCWLITPTITTDRKGYAMKESTLQAVSQPDEAFSDSLHELLRQGARKLIMQAVNSEMEHFLEQHADQRLPDGRQAVVRNGYLPERSVQTGIGAVAVQVPKARDRSGSGARFTSSLLPPYLKRSRSVSELIPWLYLKGISTGDYQEALSALLGKQAKGLSANTVSRLKAKWIDEHATWRTRDLSDRRYVYWWADGVYSNVRMDDRLCLLVIIGVTEHGRKELVAVEDGYRESAADWQTLLTGLR